MSKPNVAAAERLLEVHVPAAEAALLALPEVPDGVGLPRPLQHQHAGAVEPVVAAPRVRAQRMVPVEPEGRTVRQVQRRAGRACRRRPRPGSRATACRATPGGTARARPARRSCQVGDPTPAVARAAARALLLDGGDQRLDGLGVVALRRARARARRAPPRTCAGGGTAAPRSSRCRRRRRRPPGPRTGSRPRAVRRDSRCHPGARGGGGRRAPRRPARNAGHHLLPAQRVAAHERPLGGVERRRLGQHLAGHRDRADVVQPAGEPAAQHLAGEAPRRSAIRPARPATCSGWRADMPSCAAVMIASMWARRTTSGSATRRSSSRSSLDSTTWLRPRCLAAYSARSAACRSCVRRGGERGGAGRADRHRHQDRAGVGEQHLLGQGAADPLAERPQGPLLERPAHQHGELLAAPARELVGAADRAPDAARRPAAGRRRRRRGRRRR